MADLPDIVLVVFDTARVDRFGCYGYEQPTTPTVDALARDGLRIDPMIANGPWTMPSHASLFTGLYPAEHGCQWQSGLRLRDHVEVTLAEWLRGLGYHTICATNNGLISDGTGLARGFDRYGFRLDLERGRRRLARRLEKVLVGGDSGGRIVNEWIEGELRDARRPTFLFVNYLECHWAYAPPRRFERRVGGERFGYLEGLRYRATSARSAGPWEAIARADHRVLDVLSSLYDGELANADDHLRGLMGILERTGHLRDGETVLLVTSDHGEHLGEHGLADHHASIDDHLTRVPFVAYGPGLIPSGMRGLSELVDVFPSIARLLGHGLPSEALRGRRSDLFVDARTPDLDDAHQDDGTEELAFIEWRSWSEKEFHRLRKRNPSYDLGPLNRDLVGVRSNRFKLVRSSDRELLFDLEADPDEHVDVASSFPDVAARLHRRLDEAVETWTTWNGEERAVSDEEKKEIEQRLEELGYI